MTTALIRRRRRYGVLSGEPAGRLLAEGGVYLNVSQFSLSLPRAFGWLGKNPRVQGVFFIRDLLPLETPEFFRPAERARHVRRRAWQRGDRLFGNDRRHPRPPDGGDGPAGPADLRHVAPA